MRSLKALLIGAELCLVAAHVAGCDQTPPIDENFDSSLGADFRAPTDATPDGGATNASDAAATTAP
ncbi:MAG TPA: hypothetical protein VI456_16800 [Polyangia bacterium]